MARLEDAARDDTFLASAAETQLEEEAELQDLVDTPPGLQVWSCRVSLLDTLQCPCDSRAVALLGASAQEDLEQLWRGRSRSPLREGSPMHEISAQGEIFMPRTDSEDESVMDKSDGLPHLSLEDMESETEALMSGHGGGIFEVDPMEDELPSGGQSGMMFVPADDGEEGPESL